VHDTTNDSTWIAYHATNNLGYWSVSGDHLIFQETKLKFHTFSTNQTWEVPGVGSTNGGGADGYLYNSYSHFHFAGDQILFQSNGIQTYSTNRVYTGFDLWVYDLSNNTTFVFDTSPLITQNTQNQNNIHPHYFHTIGSRTYFRACDTSATYSTNGNFCGLSASSIKTALWVYDSSNTSAWRVTPAGE
jgi:hypothetical protein